MKTRHSIFRRINLFSLWLFRKKGLGLLSFLLLNISLQAQTLDEYLIIAAENNPGLKAAYARYEASLERINQPGLPDPELRAGFFFRPMERFMGNQQADIQLMQMFPWFGTIGTQKEEANWMAQAQYQLFLEEKNRLLFEVKSTWFELIRLQEEIRIGKENLEFLEKYERLALIKFQAAGGNPNSMSNSSEMTASSSNNSMRDVLEIQISKRELENSIEQLEANKEPLEIKFNQLLNRDIRAAIQLPSEFSPIQLEVGKLEVLDSIRKNHPLLARYDAEFSAYEQQAKMAKLDGRPMFGAGVNYMPFTAREENGMLMGGNNMVMPMLTMTLPIYRKKINSRIKEAELMKEATLLERQQTENLIAMEWANAFRDWEDAERKIKLYQAQSELTRQSLNLLLTEYSAQGEDFEEILRTQQQLLDYELKNIQAINLQHQSLAKLEMLSAASIPLN